MLGLSIIFIVNNKAIKDDAFEFTDIVKNLFCEKINVEVRISPIRSKRGI